MEKQAPVSDDVLCRQVCRKHLRATKTLTRVVPGVHHKQKGPRGKRTEGDQEQATHLVVGLVLNPHAASGV